MADYIIILGIGIIICSIATYWIVSRRSKAEVVWIDKVRKKQRKRECKERDDIYK
jgi:antibiotic biosynthesis monooxygenase (ABM) superfamily enzyme